MCTCVIGFLFQTLQVCFGRDRSLPISSVWVSGLSANTVPCCYCGLFLGEATVQALSSGMGFVPLAENSWIRMLV